MDGSSVLAGGVVDEHFLRTYRQLLDNEDSAFDELEHAYEDGDRAHYEVDLAEWERCVSRRRRFLDRNGFPPASLTA